MTRRPLPHRKLTSALAIFLSLALPIMADDKPIADDSSAGRPAAAASASSSDIEQLKKMLLDQQRQIDELRRALAAKSEAPEKRTWPRTKHPSERRDEAAPAFVSQVWRSRQHHARSSRPLPAARRRRRSLTRDATPSAPAPRPECCVSASTQDRRRLLYPRRIYGYDRSQPIHQPRIGHRHELRKHSLRNTSRPAA